MATATSMQCTGSWDVPMQSAGMGRQRPVKFKGGFTKNSTMAMDFVLLQCSLLEQVDGDLLNSREFSHKLAR
ncbi:hypothetical protein QQF64_030570 [Cirrhinus molitorella]|uniref:Uncharacterized protein n=1 Tax=Cirrhinus molitorella TaxID=172907 RepID=A0ABR3N3U1_9TELE